MRLICIRSYTSPIERLSFADSGCCAWGNTDNYFHDNNIVTAANHCRPFNPDGGSSEWLILHNTIAMNYAGNSGQTSRGISMRFGSHHHMIGFNSIDASSANTSRAIRFGGSDASWTGDDPHDIWVYHNTFRARDVALEFYGLGRGYYSWNNIYDGTSSWAVLMTDDFVGNTAVSFNNDSMRAQGLPVSKGAAYNVNWSVCDSFTAGNVSGNTLGMTFSSGNCPHSVADVPAAPSGLMAR